MSFITEKLSKSITGGFHAIKHQFKSIIFFVTRTRFWSLRIVLVSSLTPPPFCPDSHAIFSLTLKWSRQNPHEIDNFPSPPKIVYSLALHYFRPYKVVFWPKTRNIACFDGSEVFGKTYFRIPILSRFKDFKCILGGSIVVLTTQTGYSRSLDWVPSPLKVSCG